MKANLNKYHLLLSITDAFNFEISETVIRNSKSKKLLGVIFDNKLKFEKHINTICQRANRKLNALAKVTPYMKLSWFHDALLSGEHGGCSTYSRLLKTLIVAVKGGSCLKNITTLWNDALINDTLIITQPTAQLTKAYIIFTVLSGWLSSQSSYCKIYGQTNASEAVHMQSIQVLLELKDPEYLTMKPLLRVRLSVFVLLFGELDGLVS